MYDPRDLSGIRNCFPIGKSMDLVHEPWTTRALGPWWTSRCSGGVTSPEHTHVDDCSHESSTQVAWEGTMRLAKLLVVSARCSVAGDEPAMKRGRQRLMELDVPVLWGVATRRQ
jgi:hypothetical protein